MITHVINCAGQQVSNNKTASDVSFLTFDWNESVIQNITQQKVISVTVNFIQQCRKQSGCLMINYCNSQSRPFCLLACYFMVKFKWSLFKTLQFLNSRKQDVQLQPAFFDQLTNFSQKLQQKNLVRSKTWVITSNMNDQQIIITNTYLNSKNKFAPIAIQNSQKQTKKSISVSWKKQLIMTHNYCPNSIIRQKQKNINKKIQNKDCKQSRSESVNSRGQRQQKRDQSTNKQRQNKNNIPNTIKDINVTKKWAQLRQMWVKQKQNFNNSNIKNQQITQKSLIVKKQNQKLNDRLQDKLNLLKKHENKYSENNQKSSFNRNSQNCYNQTNTFNTDRIQGGNARLSEGGQNGKYFHNNWVIGNHQINSQTVKNTKNKNTNSNKSVIIVKPHTSSSLDTRNPLQNSSTFNSNMQMRQSIGMKQSRTNSLRKSDRKQGSQNKQIKQNGKFFKNSVDEVIANKVRCSSAKPVRKQNLVTTTLAIGLNKNNSLKSKGKWKL